MKREKNDYWNKYPDVSSDTKEADRIIESIEDVSIDLSDKEWAKENAPIEKCTDMGDKNGNIMDMELTEDDDREIPANLVKQEQK